MACKLMFDFANFEPEDLDELKDRLSNEKDAPTFLLELEKFLKHTRVDGGAESDRIYFLGKQFARAKIWAGLPRERLLHTFLASPRAAVDILLESEPEFHREMLKEHAIAEVPLPVPTLRMGKVRDSGILTAKTAQNKSRTRGIKVDPEHVIFVHGVRVHQVEAGGLYQPSTETVVVEARAGKPIVKKQVKDALKHNKQLVREGEHVYFSKAARGGKPAERIKR